MAKLKEKDIYNLKEKLLEYLEKTGIPIDYKKKPPVCLCFVHEEKTPSMVIYPDSVNCFGCGYKGDIFDVAGKLNNLTEFPDQLKEVRTRLNLSSKKKSTPAPKKKRENKKINLLSLPLEEARKVYNENDVQKLGDKIGGGIGKIVQAWPYTDKNNNIIAVDFRFEKGQEKNVITFYYSADTKKVRSTSSPPLIFNLYQLLQNLDKPLLFHEGPKCAQIGKDNLPNFISFSCNRTTSNVKKIDWVFLEDAQEIYFLRDDDEPGLKAAIEFLKLNPQTKIIEPPPEIREIKEKGADIEEYLELFQTPEALTQYILNPQNHYREKPKEIFFPQAGLTDTGNAQRFADKFGNDFRYCPAWGWVRWNKNHWSKDDGSLSLLKSAKQIGDEIKDIARFIEDENISAAFEHWGKKTHSRRLISDFLKLSESEEPFPVPDSNMFDRNKLLLNCKNATLDLETFKVKEPERNDLISKCCGVEYDPKKNSDIWDSFIFDIFEGNIELIKFIQKAVGYTLTGNTGERCLFFLYGTGRNGKSIFVETISTLMGAYATKSRTETFMYSRNQPTIPNDIAMLQGARMVYASEVGEFHRWNESMLKDLTGGVDKVSARFLRKEFFSFFPELKLWIYGNHKPQIRGTDDGIQSRIRLIPFNYKVPKEKIDKNLIYKLKDELPGILNWALRGLRLYQEQGLTPPSLVLHETENYFAEYDIVGNFLEDRCNLEENLSVSVARLYSEYIDWCKKSGEYELSKIKFGKRLKEKGFSQPDSLRGNSGWRWQGIGLKNDSLVDEEALDFDYRKN